MNSLPVKQQIENDLKTFASLALVEAARHLLATLGYRSEKRFDLTAS